MRIDVIMKLLPHRYPLLLIDRVLEYDVKNGQILALKNVSINEPYFNGHFPNEPVMPGVFIIEAMAQAACVLVMASFTEEEAKDYTAYLMAIESAHFRKPVLPGDALYLHITKIQNRLNVWKLKAEAKVDNQKVADATFSAIIKKRETHD